MKHLIIGDIHGRDCWREINFKAYEKVVFIGDYVDSFTLPDETIYQNLKDIVKLKKKNYDKVVLLLGNHDIHYLYFPRYQCVGFRPSMQRQLTSLFYENKHLFKIAYQKEKHIFTHAGITNSWYNEFLKLPILSEIEDEKDTIADLINKVDQTPQRHLLHTAGYFRGGQGNGGVTWADIQETQIDMLKGYHQIVGHSSVEKIQSIRYTDHSITYVDVLDHFTHFHEVDC